MSAVHQLTREDLLTILTEPRNALVKQFQRFFPFDGIELVFADESLTAVADKALERETGARGLRSIIEEILLEVQFELPSRRDVQEVRRDAETIEQAAMTPTLVTEAAPRGRRRPRREVRLTELSPRLPRRTSCRIFTRLTFRFVMHRNQVPNERAFVVDQRAYGWSTAGTWLLRPASMAGVERGREPPKVRSRERSRMSTTTAQGESVRESAVDKAEEQLGQADEGKNPEEAANGAVEAVKDTLKEGAKSGGSGLLKAVVAAAREAVQEVLEQEAKQGAKQAAEYLSKKAPELAKEQIEKHGGGGPAAKAAANFGKAKLEGAGSPKAVTSAAGGALKGAVEKVGDALPFGGGGDGDSSKGTGCRSCTPSTSASGHRDGL